MLGFLTTKEQLDWRQVDSVREAQAALVEADARVTAAKAQYDAMWARWNVQGVPLSYNSPARPAEEHFLAAQQAKAEAEQALRAAEGQAKAAAFPAWRDEQCTRAEAMLDTLDALLAALHELEDVTDRGRALQIPLLDWRIGAGQLHAEGISEMRDKFRAILDQEAHRSE